MIDKNMKRLGENIYQTVKMQEYSIVDSMVQVFMEELRKEFPDYIIERWYFGVHTTRMQPKILIQVPIQHNEDIVRAYNDLRDALQIQGGLRLKMSETYIMDNKGNIGHLKTDDRHILFLVDITEYKVNNLYASNLK